MGDEARTEVPLELAGSVDAQLLQAALERSLFGNEVAPIRLGRFVIVDRIGQGAMGVVYRAFDPELGRIVAIKVLARGRESHSERSRREAQILARLNHPNVVTVHEVGVEHGRLYVAMEFVDGTSLNRWCQQHPDYDAARVRALIGMFEQAAQGVLAAHRAGIIHRDLKPGNILVDREGRVRIADFGLARLEREHTQDGVESLPASGSGSEPLTRTGAAVGTPAYMAPEQFAGHANECSDQFGLCAAFFEAFHGVRPFAGATASELQSNIEAGRVATPPRRGVPDRIARVLARGLAISPADRWPGIEALATAFRLAATPRRVGPTVGAVGLAGLVGVVAVLARTSDDRCAGAAEQLEGVWDDAARARTDSALADSGVADAAEAARRTVAALDGYADEWRAGHRDACEATHVRGEQSGVLLDARMACLRERRRGLAALVEVLASGDREVASRAVQAVQSLASVAACSDTQYVSAPIEQPEPSSRTRAEALRDEIARAEALTLAGRFGDGLVVAQQAAAEAAELDFAPLVGLALRHRGVLEVSTGALDAAERTLREGLLAATRGRDDETVFNIALELASLIGLYRERHEDGLWWAEVARANATRIGERGSSRMWRLPLTIGALRERQARYDEALRALEEALAILRADGREHTYAGAEVTSRIATVHEQRGDLELALQMTRSAAVMGEEILGSAHEAVASYVGHAGSILQKMGRDDEAFVELERALRMREEGLGPEHPHVADSLMSLAVLHKNRGELQPALQRLQRALAIYEAAMGVDHPRVARCLGNLGNLYVKLHDYDKAFAALERAAKIFERELGPKHPDLAKTIQALGNAEWKRGNPIPAKATLDRALAIQESSLGVHHVAIATTLSLRGQVLLDLGRPKEAIVDLERGLALREGKAGRPEQRAGLEFALARALWAGGGDRERARTLARNAAVALASSSEEEDERVEIERWLNEHAPPGG